MSFVASMILFFEDSLLQDVGHRFLDQLLRIPIQGGVGSLNASVAAALGIFEWRRGHEK